VPITAVSKILGHANPAVTMSIYAHELKEDFEQVRVAMAKFAQQHASRCQSVGIMNDEQHDAIIQQIRYVNERLQMIEGASRPQTDAYTPKELEAFATQFLSQQETFGPSLRTTLDWAGALRICAMQFLLILFFAITYFLINSGQ
jgi:hypothetical protein